MVLNFWTWKLASKIASKTTLYILGLILFTQTALFSQAIHGPLRAGDRQYDRDNYKEAEKQYRIAADLKFANPKALYNLGNALYQQGNWADAAQRFSQAAKYSADKAGAANAWHNLGNACLKQQKFKEAVEAYESSLRLRPGDNDTKTNLQMARKKLKEQQQKQEQQKQEQQDQSKGEQQDQNKAPGQDGDQPQKPNEQSQEQQPNQQQQQPDKQPEQTQPGKMKKEEVQRLLETAIGPEDQRNARKYRSAQQRNKPKSSKKDW